MNVLKLQLGGEVRRASPTPQTYDELVALAKEYFNGVEVVGCTYPDEHGEKITIDCHTDFVEAVNFCTTNALKMMKLEVIPDKGEAILISSIPLTDSFYPSLPDEEYKVEPVRNASQNTELYTNEAGNDPIAPQTNEASCDTAVETSEKM
jgi:hypothetical protein